MCRVLCRDVLYIGHAVVPLQISMPFPEGGLVYDYRLDDGGVSKTGEEEEEEEQKKTKVSRLSEGWERGREGEGEGEGCH